MKTMLICLIALTVVVAIGWHMWGPLVGALGVILYHVLGER